MSQDLLERYEQLKRQANDYHRRALWQEKLRILQEMQAIIGPETSAQQDVLYELGSIRRRLGQYESAESLLRQALAADLHNPLKRAYILGELAVVLRHADRYEEALKACNEQYSLAQDAGPGLDADAELCRAVGNAGMCAYNLWTTAKDVNSNLLTTAEEQLRERIQRAQRLQAVPSKAAIAKTWETIGMGRLTQVLI